MCMQGVNKSGIYKILCKTSKKLYIGSAVIFRKRFIQHRSALRLNKHSNKYLQNAWNKYSESDFIFEIIEECGESVLLEREQYWLDKTQCYKREFGFNSATIAIDGNNGSKKYNVIDPDGNEYVVINLYKFAREHNFGHTGLHKVAYGEARAYKGWLCKYYDDTWDQWEARRDISRKSGVGWKGDWLITKKDGTIIRVKSLHTFAKENNYSQCNLHMICTGRRNYTKDIIKLEKVEEELL